MRRDSSRVVGLSRWQSPVLATVRIVIKPLGCAAHTRTTWLTRDACCTDTFKVAQQGRVRDLMIDDLGRTETSLFWKSKLVFLQWHFNLAIDLSDSVQHQ